MFERTLKQALAPAGLVVVDRQLRLAERRESERLRHVLVHERHKVARLKTLLEEARTAAQALDDRIQTLERKHQELHKQNKNLHQRLRWHWAAYPYTTQSWEEQAEGSDPFQTRARLLKAKLVDLIARPEFESGDRRVTAVVTSCSRHDLLVRTLASFFERNTYPIEKLIVVEDGARELDQAFKMRFSNRPIEWMSTGVRVGQIRAIDAAYARVSTPYIFHIEDDYEFLAPGFIEDSMSILESEPLCLQVWIRGAPGPGAHPVDDTTRTSQGAPWRRVSQHMKNVWHGFSFNPGLRRLRDYRLIGSSYAANAEPERGFGGMAEAQLSELYASVGFFAAALWKDEGATFARHLGRGHHVA